MEFWCGNNSFVFPFSKLGTLPTKDGNSQTLKNKNTVEPLRKETEISTISFLSENKDNIENPIRETETINNQKMKILQVRKNRVK